ncbi:kinase-like protein [Rhizopus microsporus var. microsporus]|uniref:Kinase-like protein n=1 Tax=Rhizopus microsporus var. microsporus TaxID=86635 RepID=A0A1X0QVF9_RHIZD|nr:kinase-like protein [Rhizopus microsporus var. microsporus]
MYSSELLQGHDSTICWSDVLRLDRSMFMKGWRPRDEQYATLYDELLHHYFSDSFKLQKVIEQCDRPLLWLPYTWFRSIKALPSGIRGQIYLAHCRLPWKCYASLEQLIPQVDQWSFHKIYRTAFMTASVVRDLHKTDKVHPNLQPKNILIKGTQFSLVDTQPLGKTLYGRYPYFAPEMRVDQASNVYALGIILWQLVSGVIFPTSVAVCPEVYKMEPLKTVDGSYQTIFTQCLAKDPRLRPTAQQVCDSLIALLLQHMSISRHLWEHGEEVRQRQARIVKCKLKEAHDAPYYGFSRFIL